MKPALIETMLANGQGQVALWDRHMRRLERSAMALGYPVPLHSDILEAVRSACLSACSTPRAPASVEPASDAMLRVRLLLDHEGKVSVTATPLGALAANPKIIVSATALDSSQPWLQHKTTHRPWYEKATQWLGHHPDYFDVIFLNQAGELCEGSRTNLYLKIDGQWLTPPIDCGVLPGVWREALLEQGQVREARLDASVLTPTTPVRLSNGLRGWFDVVLDTTPAKL